MYFEQWKHTGAKDTNKTLNKVQVSACFVVTPQNDNGFSPACIRLMDMLNPQRIVCFPEKYTNMIPVENKRALLHPRRRRLPSPHRSFKEAERKSQPGRSAQAALDAEEGGRKGGREGGRGKEKKISKGLFFFTCDKSCSHMGGTRPSALTKGWIGWSRWAVQRGGGLVAGAAGCRPARQQDYSLSQWHFEWTVKELVPLLCTMVS